MKVFLICIYSVTNSNNYKRPKTKTRKKCYNQANYKTSFFAITRIVQMIKNQQQHDHHIAL